MSLLCLLVSEPDLRADMAPAADWLTRTEAARLAALGGAARRDRFLASRWLARRAVQQWRGTAALPVLEVAESGACVVAGNDGAHVSISHSAGFVACAAGGVPVGVDLESLARPRDELALAQAVHGADQRARLLLMPADARALAFLQWWTLKEAWLKARGQGLDFALMRSLAFDEEAAGDVAVTRVGDLVLALAVAAVLPRQIDGPAGSVWRRSRSRVVT